MNKDKQKCSNGIFSLNSRLDARMIHLRKHFDVNEKKPPNTLGIDQYIVAIGRFGVK